MKENPLLAAIKIAGSARALAKLLDVTPMAVSQWKERGVPAERAVSIEEVTGVSRELLRPDIFEVGVIRKSPAEPHG